MTVAEMLDLIIARCHAVVERQLEDAEIDLLDQGATREHVEDELRSLRPIFEAHSDRQIAEVERWLAGVTLH